LIKPDLVNVDGDKIVLCEKKDNKTLDNFIHQYKYAGSYLDRREAIDYCALFPDEPKAMELLKTAASTDRFYGLRAYALDQFDFKNERIKTAVESTVAGIVKNDPNTVVRAKAIELLGQYKKAEYKPLFEKAVSDSSYSVSGSALEALSDLDPESALAFTKKIMHQPAKGNLAAAISAVLIKENDTSNVGIVSDKFKKIKDVQDKLDLLPGFASLLLQIQNNDSFKNGIDVIVNFRNNFPGAQHDEMVAYINKDILQQVAEYKERAGLKEHVDYVKSKMN
jgi:aminopeptidase N